MKHIKIWHLPNDNDNLFFSYDQIMRRHSKFPITDYICVYECGRPDYYDEDMAWEEFNINKPVGFHAHSLSVSDIVEIDGKKLFCDSFGWKEL